MPVGSLSGGGKWSWCGIYASVRCLFLSPTAWVWEKNTWGSTVPALECRVGQCPVKTPPQVGEWEAPTGSSQGGTWSSGTDVR